MKFNFSSFILFIVLLTTACTAQTTKPAVAETTASRPEKEIKKEPVARSFLKWDEPFIEYGKVRRGEKRSHTYKFQNISKEDVEISICTACDCTTLDWTSKVIKPGEFGEIITDFDSKDKTEQETITITIILKNSDPVLHYPVVDEVKFHFDIEK
jgi:hypothetical protein